MVDTVEDVARDRAAYKLAKEYLLGFGLDGVTADVLEFYLQYRWPTEAVAPLPGVTELTR
jgi:hypothetical protein